MRLESLAAWASGPGRGERVELVCDEHPDPARGARGWCVVAAPGCLTDLPLAVPFELLACGVARVALRWDGCARPEEGEGCRRDWEWLACAAHIELEEPSVGRARREVWDARQMPTLERRGLLGLGRRPAEPRDQWRPDTSASWHLRLRSVLRELGASAPEMSDAEDSSATGSGISLQADGCIASGQCVQACPNGALTLSSGDSRSALLFDPSACDGCRRCIDFCDAHALAAGPRLPWTALLTDEQRLLSETRTARCERCRSAFVPTSNPHLCAVCEARRANPFGSFLPPEAVARLARRDGDSGRPPPLG